MPTTNGIGDFRRRAARRLRLNATEAETLLWRHLRQLNLEGSHFRRQVPIGPYVADFACLAARLIIEVDGSQHGEKPGEAHDRIRTQWLESEGYRVLRFWNNEVSQSPKAVLEMVYAAVHGSHEVDPRLLKHRRRSRNREIVHPTPARSSRRPSPSRGG